MYEYYFCLDMYQEILIQDLGTEKPIKQTAGHDLTV